MNEFEHSKLLKEFKAYSAKVTATKESSKEFLIRAGINTPTGRLTKAYSPQPTSPTVNNSK